MAYTRSPRFLPGLLLLLLGVGFLFDALGAWDFGELFATWWPLLIIGLGLNSLMNDKSQRLAPYIIVAAGVLLQLGMLDLVDVNIWALFWPVVLIITGTSLLMGRQESPRTTSSSEDSIDTFVVFGGSEKKISSSNFTGGNATALFGGFKLDLRKATVSPKASLHVTAMFGGGEICVPKNCRVVFEGTPIFGGYEDKTEVDGEPDSVLVLRGTVIFGGVEVRN